MGNKESVPGVLFEYERITDTILELGLGVSLKLVADLGFKDKDDRKNRAYNEFRYSSRKYTNTDYLVSASRNVNFSLRFDYPNLDENAQIKKNNILINSYAILGLQKIIQEFDNIVFDPYKVDKKGKIHIISDQVKEMRSFPVKGSMITFSHEIYETKDGEMDYGVEILFNDDYQIIIRTTTTWKSLVYYITTCDLYAWGSILIAPYITQLVGNSVSESGNYNMTKRYQSEITYEPDPENIAEAENLKSKNKATKPVTKSEKVKSFFDD